MEDNNVLEFVKFYDIYHNRFISEGMCLISYENILSAFSRITMKFYVPDGLLEEVVCTYCQKFLSVFPVYVARAVGKRRCGRCPTPDLNDGFVRDEIYETFMEQLLFPCVNHVNGCKEFMKPADTVEHEQYCIYNPISCMVPLCNWNGPKNLLIDHINCHHQEMMLNQSSFELSFSESSKEINFVKYNSQLFLVHWEYDFPANEFKMSVKHIKMELKSANYKYLYYLKFSAGPNYYKSDKKSTVNEDNWIIESVNTLKNRLKNPTVIWVYINIGNLDDFQVRLILFISPSQCP